MASRLLCTLEGIEIRQDEDGRVHWRGGGMGIDADGINGGSRHPVTEKKLFAYGPNNSGLDYNANAGYPAQGYEGILVCDARGNPIDQGGGWFSRTAYSRGKEWPEESRWLDGLKIPFIVVEGFIRRRARGVVLGCRTRVTYLGLSVDCMVGDIGPLYKIGEGSPRLACDLGIDPNPRFGGTDSDDIEFELWPGEIAVLNGERFDLKSMNLESSLAPRISRGEPDLNLCNAL